MKRVQGTKGVSRFECINADQNKWSVRWDIQDNPESEENRQKDGINYMEETFLFKPDLSDVQSVVAVWCSGEDPKGIFVLDGKTITLDLDSTLLLRDQAQQAEKDGETTVPLITNAGVIEIAPQEVLFVVGCMLAYLTAYDRNITAQLEAIGKAESIDALTEFDFQSGYPQPASMTLEEVRAAIRSRKATPEQQAVLFARMAINTMDLSNADALAVKDLHPSWESFIGKPLKAKSRVTYQDVYTASDKTSVPYWRTNRPAPIRQPCTKKSTRKTPEPRTTRYPTITIWSCLQASIIRRMA